MAEELQTGVCSGGWWNTTTRGGFDVPEAAAAVSCSVGVSDVSGSTGWTTAVEVMEGKGRSGEDSVATASGGSSVTFQDAPGVHVSDPRVTGGFLMESTLPMADFSLSSPTVDWSQTLLRNSGRVEGGFHSMLHDELSSRACYRHETGVESNQFHAGGTNTSKNNFKGANHGYILDQSHLNTSVGGDSSDCAPVDSFRAVPSSLGCPPTLLQGLFDQDVKPQPSSYDARSTSFMSPTSYQGASSEDSSQAAPWSRFPQFLKASPPKQQQQQQPLPTHQLQFSNNTPFWNASAAASAEARSGYYAAPQAPFVTVQKFEEKPNCSTITVKSSSEGARHSSSGAKKSATEPAFKKPRIDQTPSSLPTFKVRKEKLGDRITALQQLVSPFGKTDTASVLYEAIEYIKFLHEQVSVLGTPYLKNGPAMKHQQVVQTLLSSALEKNKSEKLMEDDGPKQDLRSRGLCLVPISSTFAVASEPMSDFWTPTFGGTYR